MSADALLERIEQLGLLEANVITSLRKQVSDSGVRISPETIVQMLVDKGLLTSFQGKKLLSDIAAETVMLNEEELELALDEEDEEFAVSPPPPPNKSAPNKSAPNKTEPNKNKPGGKSSPPSGPPAKSKKKWKTSEPKVKSESAEAAPAMVPIDDGPVHELVPIDDAGGLTPLGGSDPFGADPFGADPLGMGQTQPQMQQPQGPRERKTRKNPWESALMFVGGGVLVVLLLVGVALYFSLSSAPAAEVFEQAEESYKSEQYLEAIERYEQFITDYPDDENASLARVRQGLARLRQVVRGARDWSQPLATAQKELPKIETEASFPSARDELAAILPQIAEGFATQAQEAKDFTAAATHVEQAEEAMKLVNNPVYIPPSLRKSPGTELRIDRILAAVATVRRDLSREQDLVDAVTGIEKAAEAGDTAQAYALRDTLLKTYPGLVANRDLQDAVRTISKKQRELVNISRGGPEPAAGERFAAPDFQIVLAGNSGETAARSQGRIAVFRVEGAVYGVDAATGEVRWRRYTGYDPAPQPVRVADASSDDVLVVDPREHELLRLEAATGKLLWRTPIGKPLSTPSSAEGALVATDATGTVYSLDPATGACLHQAVLPQSTSLPAAVDAAASMCYVVADHTNVYALALPSLECRAVYYLGHKAGAVAAAPLALRGHLLIAENTSAADSRLHAISTGRDGASLTALRVDFPIRGRVLTPPLSQSGRVLVLSDLGAIHVYEVDPTNKRSTVSAVDDEPATESQSKVLFAAADQGQLFVGGNRLTKYEIQTSLGKLIRKWPIYEGDVFVGPVQVFDDVVASVRRRQGAIGLTAAACQTSDGAEVWRTSLGAPLAGEAYADTQRQRLVAVTSSGQLFEIDPESIKAGYLGQPSFDLGAKQREGLSLASRFDLGEGRLAFASLPPDTRIANYDPLASESLQLVTPRVPSRSLTCAPVLFEQGLLFPCDDGRIYLVDPVTGNPLAKPFQPPLSAGQRVAWGRPAPLAEGRFVVTDDRRKLYIVELKDSPEPHLAGVEEADVAQEITSPLAVVGESILAARRERSSDVLAVYGSDLAAGAESAIKGRVVWGPYAVGAAALAATDRGELLCIDGSGETLWSVSVGEGRLTGAPLRIGQEVVVASTEGVVKQINLSDGQETASLDLGQPLGAAPVPFAGRFLLTGSDGIVYIVDLAKSTAS
ncbi:MAG: PQQ-binding-like beta-propeller repeat protein [Pirellulaceae bacterium]